MLIEASIERSTWFFPSSPNDDSVII